MSSILGSASEEQKELVVNLFREFCGADGRFGAEQARRIVVKQLDYQTKQDGDLGPKTRARLTCELKVEPDMLHNANAIHGGCILFLVDICTSVCHAVDTFRMLSVSLTTHFHNPAFLGNTLRIVAETVSVGKRVIVVRCEIYEIETGLIVASGQQIKMAPQSANVPLNVPMPLL